jgi:GT2 family glycosyltransferase
MISILLPAYKSANLLQKVFPESAFKVPVEIVIYDNGGNNQTPWELYKQFKFVDNVTVQICGSGHNIGLNAALNTCAFMSQYDYLYLPHTDMVLMAGWDTALLKQAKKFPEDKFLFCSRSIEPHQGHTPFQIIKNYGDEVETFNPEQLVIDFLDYKDPSIVTGYRMPFFMHRKLWKKMGGVDENYFSYATDDDLFMTAYDVGVRRFWMINQSLVYHLQGKSNAQQTVDKDSRKPYEYFEEKWAKKGYNTKQPIDSLLQSLIPWNVKIN